MVVLSLFNRKEDSIRVNSTINFVQDEKSYPLCMWSAGRVEE